MHGEVLDDVVDGFHAGNALAYLDISLFEQIGRFESRQNRVDLVDGGREPLAQLGNGNRRSLSKFRIAVPPVYLASEPRNDPLPEVTVQV